MLCKKRNTARSENRKNYSGWFSSLREKIFGVRVELSFFWRKKKEKTAGRNVGYWIYRLPRRRNLFSFGKLRCYWVPLCRHFCWMFTYLSGHKSGRFYLSANLCVCLLLINLQHIKQGKRNLKHIHIIYIAGKLIIARRKFMSGEIRIIRIYLHTKSPSLMHFNQVSRVASDCQTAFLNY